MQIASPERVVIIDPLAMQSLEPLRAVLESERIVKVIHNAAFERGVFASIGLGIVGVFDTLEASRAMRGREALGGHSLGAVCERELGVTLDKQEQTSAWARRPLSVEQLAYAGIDAEVLMPLHARLAELLAKASIL